MTTSSFINPNSKTESTADTDLNHFSSPSKFTDPIKSESSDSESLRIITTIGQEVSVDRSLETTTKSWQFASKNQPLPPPSSEHGKEYNIYSKPIKIKEDFSDTLLPPLLSSPRLESPKSSPKLSDESSNDSMSSGDVFKSDHKIESTKNSTINSVTFSSSKSESFKIKPLRKCKTIGEGTNLDTSQNDKVKNRKSMSEVRTVKPILYEDERENKFASKLIERKKKFPEVPLLPNLSAPDTSKSRPRLSSNSPKKHLSPNSFFNPDNKIESITGRMLSSFTPSSAEQKKEDRGILKSKDRKKNFPDIPLIPVPQTRELDPSKSCPRLGRESYINDREVALIRERSIGVRRKSDQSPKTLATHHAKRRDRDAAHPHPHLGSPLSHEIERIEREQKIQQRLIVQKQLQYIHKCLKTVLLRREFTLYLKDEGWLHYHILEQTDRKLTTHTCRQVLNHIYLTINRSLFADNFFYFDDGNIFSLLDLDKMVTAKYHHTKNIVRQSTKKLLDSRQKIIKNTADKFLQSPGNTNECKDEPTYDEMKYLAHLKTLSLPDSENWTTPVRDCRYALQRLYCLQNPAEEKHSIMSPKAYLFECFKHVTSKELFGHCSYLLNLEETHMPYKQKIILLNFCKSYAVNIQDDQKLMLNFPEQKDPLIKNLCEEVELMVHGAMLKKNQRKEIKTIDEIIKLVETKDFDSDKFHLFVRNVSKDLKLISASSFKHFTVQQFLEMEKVTVEPVIYYNQVVNFVRNIFLDVIKTHVPLDDSKPINSNALRSDCFYLYYLFLFLGKESFNAHDHLSAVALLSGISLTSLERVLKDEDSPRMTPELKSMLSLKKAILSPIGNFEFLTERIKECQKNKEFYVPALTSWSRRGANEKTAIDLYGDEHRLTKFERLALFTKEKGLSSIHNIIVEVGDYLEDFRMQCDILFQHSRDVTDIRGLIYQSREMPEQDSDQLYALIPKS